MKIKSLLLGLYTLSAFNSFAQNEEAAKHSFRIQAFSVQTGLWNAQDGARDQFSTFKSLAPKSELLKRDYQGFGERFSFFDDLGEVSSSFAVYATSPIDKGSLSKLSPQWRFGIRHLQNSGLTYSREKSDYFRVDTLTSTSGDRFYVDSLSQQTLEVSYQRQEIMLDAAFLISTNPASRWSLQAGLGLNFGFAYQARTDINYIIRSDFDNEAGFYYRDSDEKWESESFSNKLGISTAIYMPFILDFRIARRGGFFSRSHLYVEYRPELYFSNTPELDPLIQNATNFSWGFRYEIE